MVVLAYQSLSSYFDFAALEEHAAAAGTSLMELTTTMLISRGCYARITHAKNNRKNRTKMLMYPTGTCELCADFGGSELDLDANLTSVLKVLEAMVRDGLNGAKIQQFQIPIHLTPSFRVVNSVRLWKMMTTVKFSENQP